MSAIEQRLSRRIRKIQPPPITEVKSWLAHRPDDAKPLIDLCQAVPSYPPADSLRNWLKQQLDDDSCYRYTPDEGLPQARQDICNWYQRLYPEARLASDQLCLTIGASQAFWLAIGCLCQPGDEVIVQSPAYFDHPMALQALGVDPVFAPFRPENNGLPDVTELERMITPKTKALLLVTPSNPTGAMIPPALAESLLELAINYDLTLIFDETYNAFVGHPPHQLFSRADWSEHFVQVASFGKTFALTGLRAGALVADSALIEQALKVQDSMAVCQPHLTQLAVAYGCRELDAWVSENCLTMAARHQFFRDHFLAAKHSFKLAASGSFFAWIGHPWSQLSGRQAARKMLDEAAIICLPGEAFGPGLEGYLRLALGNIDEQKIVTAVERLELF